MTLLTEVEIKKWVNGLNNQITIKLEESAMAVDQLVHTHILQDVPSGYQRTEKDLIVYRKCQLIMELMAAGVFGERGTSIDERFALQAILDATAL